MKKSNLKIMFLGSGELGKEFVISAQRLGLNVVAVDRYESAPAMHVADAFEVISSLVFVNYSCKVSGAGGFPPKLKRGLTLL